MVEVINIEDDIADTCSCGSTQFNLLKSGRIECSGCGNNKDNKFWLGPDLVSQKALSVIIGLMAMTKDDMPTVVTTLIGLGHEKCKENGMDSIQYLKDIS